MNNILIAPSILAADVTALGHEVEKVIHAGADLIHLDIMDNHYVPNLTFGPQLCEALHHKFPHAKLDVHLMTTPVEDLIAQFADRGAKRISIHPETTLHLDRSLALIKSYNCEAGLVLNPATSPECLLWVRPRIDFVLVMTVNPGFGGQTLIESVIPKITWIKKHYPHLPICVDGGINKHNIAKLAQAGANEFVIGNALFSTSDYQKTIQELRQAIALG